MNELIIIMMMKAVNMLIVIATHTFPTVGEGR